LFFIYKKLALAPPAGAWAAAPGVTIVRALHIFVITYIPPFSPTLVRVGGVPLAFSTLNRVGKASVKTKTK